MNAQDYSPRNWIPISITFLFVLTTFLGLSPRYANSADETLNLTYPIVDTSQVDCYNNTTTINAPVVGDAFYGQDAQHTGHQADYTVSDDGLTVYDGVTGLVWTQSPDLNADGVINIDDKLTFDQAQVYPDVLNDANFGGFNDWRIPTIKELYSLMDFTGQTRMSAAASVPYINTDYFAFGYGDESAGERFIDAQFCTSSVYVSTVMNGQAGMFGVNFADGRIKCYPIGTNHGYQKTFYALFVRGNTSYGINDFIDNGDGTVTDNGTGLMWTQDDTGQGLNWQDALAQVRHRRVPTQGVVR